MTQRQHGTLTANVELVFTLTSTFYETALDVLNFGPGTLYFTLDGSTATVQGLNTYVVPAEQELTISLPAGTVAVPIHVVADAAANCSGALVENTFRAERRGTISQQAVRADGTTLEVVAGVARVRDGGLTLTKFVQATQDAFNNKVDKPTAPVAFTQTYNLTAATVPNPPANLVLTTPTDLATCEAACATLRDAVNTDRAAITQIAKLLNQLINIDKAGGLAS